MTTVTTTELPAASRLRRAVTLLHRRLRQLGHEELTLTQSSALASIIRRGPLTLGELATCENVAPPTVTKAVGALEDRGYVTRAVDPDDRRVARVTATDDGRRYLEELTNVRTAWLHERLATLPEADRRRLLDALDVLEALSTDPGEVAP